MECKATASNKSNFKVKIFINTRSPKKSNLNCSVLYFGAGILLWNDTTPFVPSSLTWSTWIRYITVNYHMAYTFICISIHCERNYHLPEKFLLLHPIYCMFTRNPAPYSTTEWFNCCWHDFIQNSIFNLLNWELEQAIPSLPCLEFRKQFNKDVIFSPEKCPAISCSVGNEKNTCIPISWFTIKWHSISVYCWGDISRWATFFP